MSKLKKDSSVEYWKNEAERYRNLFNYKFVTGDPVGRAALKEDSRLYRKVGAKFVAVNDPYAYEGLRNGFWLVHVKDGCTSIRQQVSPDNSRVTAAARLLEDKLVDIIRKISEARPSSVSLTVEEKKDWDNFIKKHGNSFNTLHYPSIQENAEKIIEALIGEGAK
jgi:hypothetical protein